MHPSFLIVLYYPLFLVTLLTPLASARGQERKPPDPGGASSASRPSGAMLDDLLAAHNKVRAAEKKPPLRLNALLTRAAAGQARDMAERDKLTHEGSDGSEPKTRIQRVGYHYQEIGENVAAGQETVGEAMRSWIDSPPHRENILGDFTEMGGAVAKGPDGKNYWCVDFGRPMPAVDPAKSPGEMLAALNKARREAGKKSMRRDDVLDRVAARFALLAAERKSLAARDRDGKTPFDVLQGEGYQARRFAITLASGEGDPGKVVAQWMKEPKDRAALLSGFERAGVGVAADPDGVPYWVILLAQGGGG